MRLGTLRQVSHVMKSYILSALAFILLFPILSKAQLTVIPTHPAAVLASKLAGSGITITSPVLTCPVLANGTFTSVATPILIDSGIVLTTGRAINTAGTEAFLASVNNGAAGDPALTTLAGTTTFDACTLEFDFVPKGDTVSFNYQFGSEEYINSTCGQYNDAFAFFISGPGIPGVQNMALVPGTNIPVTVNSINSGVPGPPGWPGFCDITNCTSMGPGSPFTTYYINNTGGTLVTYRGYTTKLKAQHWVTPCSTYHLKMSIADAANGLYDSGVFIEAGSLSTNSYVFKRNDSIGHTINGIPNAIVRGCDPDTMYVLSGRVATSPQKVYFTYTGTAIHGTDFSAPDSATIATGDTSVYIIINGNPSTPTGPKTITIYLSSAFSCGNLDTISLTLLDAPTASITTPDTSICLGHTIQLHTTGSAGLVYNWTPGATLSSASAMEPFATPVANTTYTMSATLPLSGCPPIAQAVSVSVNVADMHIVTPDTTICKNEYVKIITAGTPGLAYSWTPIATVNIPNHNSPIVTPVTTTTYSVTAISPTDGCTAFDQITITVIDPVITITNPTPAICYGYNVKLLVTGNPSYTYHWDPATGLDDPNIQEPFAGPLTATTYTVTAKDPVLGCTTSAVATVTVLPRVIPTAWTPKPICLDEPAPLYSEPSGIEFTYQWDGPNGYSSILQNPFIRRADISTQGFYTVTVTNTNTGCFGTDTTYVIVGGAIPAFTFVTPDQSIELGSSVQLDARGATMYTWVPNDGSLSNPNINNPIATPSVTTTYAVIAFDSLGCKNIDSVTIEVNSEDGVYIPSAFTPDGDGLNDLFRAARMGSYTLLEMNVFDRWGQLIYHHEGNDRTGWDGTVNGQPATMGTYYYIFILSDRNRMEKVVKGDVTLIR